ncbi:MAG: LysR family transcriptional regulator [Asticcacaulis sp.]
MIDWTLWRSFLAVVETGSLSAAASQTGATQPTLSRHIHELEQSLGLSLFRRVPRGLEPTPAALGLIEDARRMGDAAHALTLKAAGRTETLAGTVRLSASVIVSNLVLPGLIADLREAEPLIQVEIVASDEAQNLLRRDADIAIRMFRPSQPTLIARKLGDTPLGLFGARRYLDRCGRPNAVADLLHHDVIGFDRGEDIIKGYAVHGFQVMREQFPIRCDDQMVHWHLLLAGAGLGFAQCLLAEKAGLESLDIGLGIPPLPVWLVMHEDLRAQPRVRRVAEFMGDRLKQWLRA